MPFSIRIIRELEELDPKLRNVFFVFLEEIEKNVGETVKRSDFLELTQVVTELGKKVTDIADIQKSLVEAQKKTEERLNSLAQTVEELSEAQKKTEERLDSLAQRVEQLAEAQKRSEHRIEELTQAQKKTEERLDLLAQKVEELAEAQNKTEEELKTLTYQHKKTRELLGNISDTVGYGLEDKIMPYVSYFAEEEYGIEVDVIDRRNIVYPTGKHDEANIYVEGRKNGEKVYIIGECKSRPGKKDLDDFYFRLKRIKAYLNAPVYAFVVGYVYSPEVENYIKGKYPEIKALKSFEFELRYLKRIHPR